MKDIDELAKVAGSAAVKAALENAPEVPAPTAEPRTPPAANEPFPLHHLPPAIGEMARAICATERVPESLAGCCVLGFLSASIGAGLCVKSGTNRETRGNLYILASAESGSGKSETFRHAARPFLQFEAERLETWKKEVFPGLLADKDMIEADIAQLKKPPTKDKQAMPRGEMRAKLQALKAQLQAVEARLEPPVLSCEDVTVEKLAVMLACNGEQLASLSADAGAVVNCLLGKYSKLDRTDEGLYLKAFSGDRCRIDRKSSPPVVLASPCLAALWLTQPDKIETLLAERSLTDGGLIPRLLSCHTQCEPRPIIEGGTPIPPHVADEYGRMICNLLPTYRLAETPLTIEASADAMRELNTHHNALVEKRKGELRDITSFAARWSEQAWRIAVCIHAGAHGTQAHKHPLALETAQAAIALADWFAGQQLAILAGGRTKAKHTRAEKLNGLLAGYGGTATLRDLARNNGFEADEVRTLAAQFPHLLKIEKTETGGRPSETASIPKK